MATDIGPKIGIQGEAEYKRSMRELAAATKTLGTEAKLVTSEFAGEEKSTEALKAKNDVLQRSVYQLNDVLEKQEEHLKQVARAYGEADSRTQKAQQEVNKTKTEINSFNAEIRRNNEQIEISSTAFGKLGNALGGYVDQLGLGNTALGKMTSSLSSGTLAATAFSAAVVKLSAELVKLSNDATKHGDDVATLAAKYNTTTQSIQQFQYMAELTDVSVETITGSLTKLTRNMDSARGGTGAAAEAFARLGVSVTNSDGSLRSANEVFSEAIDALGRIGNETDRDALAMSLFGKSAMELNPLIKPGADGLRELADEAANSGYVMSDKMISVLQEGDDASQRFDKAMDGLKNTIGAGVTPIVAGWKMILAEAADDMSVFIQKLAGMRDGADETAESISKTAAEIEKMSDAARGWRDVTAEDLIPESQKAWNEYLKNMNSIYSPMGIDPQSVYGFMNYEQFTSRYYPGESVNINVQLDSQTIARATYNANQAEASRRGSRATY